MSSGACINPTHDLRFHRASQKRRGTKTNQGREDAGEIIEIDSRAEFPKPTHRRHVHTLSRRLPRYGATAPVQQRRPATGRFTNNDVGRSPAAWARPRCRSRHERAISHYETNLSADGSGPARRTRCRHEPRRPFDECEFDPVVTRADRDGCTPRRQPLALGSALTPGASPGGRQRPAAAAPGSLRTRYRPHSAPAAGP